MDELEMVRAVPTLPKTRKAIQQTYPEADNTAWELKCRITDLTWKRYFVDRGIALFGNRYGIACKEPRSIGDISLALMDCYFYFEVVLFEAKAYLDLLAPMYSRLIDFRGTMPKKSFNKFREWLVGKSPNNFPPDIIDYFKSETRWFDLLKYYRDMLAHTQGFNPMVGQKADGTLILELCTIIPGRYNLCLNEILQIIGDGINRLTEFSDSVLSSAVMNRS